MTARVSAWVLLALGGFGLAMHHAFPIIARFALDRPSSCMMQVVSGIACIGCRGTRSAFSFANGNLLQSFLFNPMVAIGFFGLAVWALVVGTTGRNFDIRLSKPVRVLMWITLIAILAGSWIYVIRAEWAEYRPGPWPLYRT